MSRYGRPTDLDSCKPWRCREWAGALITCPAPGNLMREGVCRMADRVLSADQEIYWKHFSLSGMDQPGKRGPTESVVLEDIFQRIFETIRGLWKIESLPDRASARAYLREAFDRVEAEQQNSELRRRWFFGDKTDNTKMDTEEEFSLLVQTADRLKISHYLAVDDYDHFLQTGYWDLIRRKKRKDAGDRCGLCSHPDHLHVHHKTYAHRGSEYCRMEDLIVLCSGCHAKFHDKLPSKPAWRIQ